MASTKIVVNNDGSIRVEGDFEITKKDGQTEPLVHIVVRARRFVVSVEDIGVARVIVARHQHAAIGLCRIGALQHRIDILQPRWFGDAGARRG